MTKGKYTDSKLTGQLVTSIDTKIKKIIEWMTQSILGLQSLNFYPMILTKHSNVCIYIKISSKQTF